MTNMMADLFKSIEYLKVTQDEALGGDLREILRVTWDGSYAEVITTNPGGIVLAFYAHDMSGWNFEREYPSVKNENGTYYRFPSLGAAIACLGMMQMMTIDEGV